MASSSAPIYFDPTTYTNQYNYKEYLIDGGLIANDPSLYAFFTANMLKGHKKIRILSLGTGV